MDVLLTLILLLNVSSEGTLRDHFDRIEVNHFYDDNGIEMFTQILFYDIQPENKWKCQDWKLMKDAYVPLEGEELVQYKKDVDRYVSGIKDLIQRSQIRHKLYEKSRKFVGGRWYPRRRWNRHYNYEIIVIDDNLPRHITSDMFCETHTQYDPEKNNRKLFVEDGRRGLKK